MTRLRLSPAEMEAKERIQDAGGLPFKVTDHWVNLIGDGGDDDPLRRQVVPSAEELAPDRWSLADPLGETGLEAVPNLVHRYPDRALLLVTDRCSAYCRFCTRKRMVGVGPTPTQEHLEQAFAYLERTPSVHEVILSGGDALTLSNAKLARILVRLRAIPHLDILRIATRTPAFDPARVDDELLRIVRENHPVYFLVHFNHPRELEGAAADAVTRLVDAGIPVLSQTVLLAGVNDDVSVLTALFRRLTHLRARPYYLHQCDLAEGTAHFRVPLGRALKLIGGLRGHLSGLSVPSLVIDIPGGNGKVVMAPNPVVDEREDAIELQGFDGGRAWYPRQ